MPDLKRLLREFRAGKVSTRQLQNALRDLPYQSLPFAKVDLHRLLRRGFPEVIFSLGKSADEVVAIAKVLRQNGHPVLATKVTPRMFRVIKRQLPWMIYYPQARMAAGSLPVPKKKNRSRSGRSGQVLVVTAGTSDIPVAEEAVVTLKLMGRSVRTLFDVGVAGLHRLLKNLSLLRKASVIVVVAGMDGALPSVISGLVENPVVAVPTSIGYGASFKGMAALLTMLNSCSPGVAVVNIDNGFGAGYLASMILSKR